MVGLELLPVAVLVAWLGRQIARRETLLWGIPPHFVASWRLEIGFVALFWIAAYGLCLSSGWHSSAGVGADQAASVRASEEQGLKAGRETPHLPSDEKKPSLLPLVSPGSANAHQPVLYLPAILFVAIIFLASRVDLTTFTIPDVITFPGMMAGLALALWQPGIELAPLWTNWEADFGQSSRFIKPEWIAVHPFGHAALRWLAGMICGAGIVWIIRRAAFAFLRMEALGFGDVTLMAALGGFLGWQATLLALAIAPVLGIGHALISHLFGRVQMIPFGPSLGVASYLVAWLWPAIWPRARFVFSDLWTLSTLGLLAGTGLVVGLLLLRVEKVPTTPRLSSTPRSKKAKRKRG